MGITHHLTDHPASEGESYGEHFRVAFGFSRQLMGAGIAAAVHAVLPNFHKTTASQRIHRLHHCLETGDRDAIRAPRLRSAPCPDSLRAPGPDSLRAPGPDSLKQVS